MEEHISNLVSADYTWCQFCPAFALVILAALLLLADAFLPKLPKRSLAIVAALGCIITIGYLFANPTGYATLFGAIACGATALSILMAFDYKKITCDSVAGGDCEEGTGEFYTLPLIACAGILCLLQARDLILLFVSLEVVTLSSYVLAGYFRRNQGSVEAGIKYLILGAMSTGLLVFGAAWYFGTTGSFLLSFDTVQGAISGGTAASNAVVGGFLMANALLFAGAFFKVGAVPMHLWIPDVYQGAPTPVSTFLAVASKTAGFAVLFVLIAPWIPFIIPGITVARLFVAVFAIVAAATLLIGNLGALTQSNAKRLLGYSSIGQAGFILVFFITPSMATPVMTGSYLLAYALATIAVFYAIAMVRTQRGSEEISAFRGLGKTNPRTAFLIVVALASLAGVPLTLGFIAKLNSFVVLVNSMSLWSHLVILLPIMILCAAAGFYYYFKIIRAMYWDAPRPEDSPLQVPPTTGIVLSLCALALIAMGTLPLLLNW